MNGSVVSITRSAPEAAAPEPAAPEPAAPGAVTPGVAETFAGLDALPAAAAALFAAAGQDLFASRLWFETCIADALPEGAAPRFVLAGTPGAPAALWPMVALRGGRALQSLTTPYTSLYRPLFGLPLTPERLTAAGHAFGRYCRAWPAVRLDALEAEAPERAAWCAGLRRAGLSVLRFDHFGNWREDLAGRDFARYLADRPGALRETIRRKGRGADAGAGFALLRTPEEIGPGILAYQAVYARSWKEPEPFPRFIPALMRAAAAAGLLRLGILGSLSSPVAVQVWMVSGGAAFVLKLAHDETARARSPGTVLTALMIREMIARDGITALDFGRGDDPYKRLWASGRRQRIGLLLVNPRHPRGLLELGRAALGAARRRLVGE